VRSQTPKPLAGAYILVCHALEAGSVIAGRLGRIVVQPGYYLYAGSALGSGGLRARLAHHMRPAGKPHWHIDYLRVVAPLSQIWFCHGPERREHLWASVLHEALGGSVPFPGFGSSDCGCCSHLFYFERRPTLRAFRASVLEGSPLHPPLLLFDPDTRATPQRR